ncbi:MAG: DUF5320 domain-containing protein [Bacteroidales bacterium]
MPGFDRTGPNGEGSRTGRALGKCNPERDNDPNLEDDDLRGGRGRRFRLGQGWWKGRNRGSGFGSRAGRGAGGAGRGAGRGAGGTGRGAGRGFGQGRDY